MNGNDELIIAEFESQAEPLPLYLRTSAPLCGSALGLLVIETWSLGHFLKSAFIPVQLRPNRSSFTLHPSNFTIFVSSLRTSKSTT
jgi:hypothetical protein